MENSIEFLERTVQRLVNERESLGAVNLRAEEEMNEMKNKIEIMSSERIDLELAVLSTLQIRILKNEISFLGQNQSQTNLCCVFRSTITCYTIHT